MSHRVYLLRNLKTEKEYTVDENGYNTLLKKDMLKRFTVLEERVAIDKPKTTFIPTEISEAVRQNVEGVKEDLRKANKGREARG